MCSMVRSINTKSRCGVPQRYTIPPRLIRLKAEATQHVNFTCAVGGHHHACQSVNLAHANPRLALAARAAEEGSTRRHQGRVRCRQRVRACSRWLHRRLLCAAFPAWPQEISLNCPTPQCGNGPMSGICSRASGATTMLRPLLDCRRRWMCAADHQAAEGRWLLGMAAAAHGCAEVSACLAFAP